MVQIQKIALIRKYFSKIGYMNFCKNLQYKLKFKDTSMSAKSGVKHFYHLSKIDGRKYLNLVIKVINKFRLI